MKLPTVGAKALAEREVSVRTVSDLSVEVVSDSGEGAQKCGQIFGALSARMGNGVWTVEIIPSEVEPPPRNSQGASGIRIRLGDREVTNWGDETNVVVAFNEQVLLGRHWLKSLAPDAIILIDGMWAKHPDPDIRKQWADAMEELSAFDYTIIEVPMEEQSLTVVDNARRGKNMFALGLLCAVFDRDMERAKEQIAYAFRGKKKEVTELNCKLLDLGYAWALENLDFRFVIPTMAETGPKLVMNGNEALALGAVAAGMELAAMYPITPATSVSHMLGEIFGKYGGVLHQAEDEIAAVGVAIGSSYSGRCAFVITSGPGLALKTEFIGLAVMAEIPVVVIDVQRGGPSTGLPTKVEQSDLLAATFGQPGDTPTVVMAPATIEECFHIMPTARRIAEVLRTAVLVLSDANLATGVAPFSRPELSPDWQAAPPDLRPVPAGTRPFDWDPKTGLSRRLIPGQPGGEHTLTGLAHDEASHVAYDADTNQRAMEARSRKLAAFQQTLLPPVVNGDAKGGDLLVVGWGSTKGAIEEAVDRARNAGLSVSSLHLAFLCPFQPGLTEIFGKFKKVMTVEINYSDPVDGPSITEYNRRYGQLAFLLRATTLVDVDCWTRTIGEPLRPAQIYQAIREHLPGGRS